MSIPVSGTAIQIIASPISISFTNDAVVQINFPINIGSLITQNGTMNGDDQDNDGLIERGETLDHDNPNVPVFDPIPDLSNAQILGVGSMSGILLGSVVNYDVILVASAGVQYLVYPDGPPDILTNVAGALTTQLTFYRNGTWGPGVGLVPCFTLGTMIRTELGQIPVEELKVGDLVLTLDHGYLPIRWIGRRQIGKSDLESNANLYPILIKKGSLGEGIPNQDLKVSPQHRVLIRSKAVARMFDQTEVLIAAKHLQGIHDIAADHSVDQVTYFHLLFDGHEVIYANGAETESLYAGPEALKAIGSEALTELYSIFPELSQLQYQPEKAREFIGGNRARNLTSRHIKNAQPLVAQL